MIDLEKVNSISKFLHQQLIKWGVEEEHIQTVDKDSKLFSKKTIRSKINDIEFIVILLATLNDTARYLLDQSPKLPHVFINWEFSVTFFIENPKNLQISIKKKKWGDKINQVLGKNHLEVYDYLFDKTFLIESNSTYAHAEIIEKKIQEKMLIHQKYFSNYTIENNKVRYINSFELETLLENESYFVDMMDIGLNLAKNSNIWNFQE